MGDVGDFGKYGLLRSLCRKDDHGPAFRLGVLWYLFDGDDSTAANDGRHTQYLSSTPSRHELGLRSCDPELFDMMLDIVNSQRSVAAVEARGVLPADTVFFSEGLSFDGIPRRERRTKRMKWFDAGLDRVREADIVFFDPDNGLEVPSRSRHGLKGPKYAYYDDLLPCWEGGQSLIVYHHMGRTYGGRGAAGGDQVAARCLELRHRLSGAKPVALRYRRRSSRVYFLLANPSHTCLLEARMRAFLHSAWGQGLAVAARRLHDTGRSARWWIIIFLTGLLGMIESIALLYWAAIESEGSGYYDGFGLVPRQCETDG